MKVLTVLQPWAWALIHGPKRVENRSWPTSYRGPLLIHAGKGRGRLSIESTWENEFGIAFPDISQLVFGSIIGIVDVVDCVPVRAAPQSPWACGPWCWIVENPRPLPPVACQGALSLWTPDASIMTWVESGLAEGRQTENQSTIAANLPAAPA